MLPRNRIEAVQSARAWMEQKPLILDTETTGLSSDDQVIELALIDTTGEVLLNTLIRPSCPINPEASAVHGITEADLVDAPTIDQVWPRAVELMRGHLVMVYNASFDTRLIAQSLAAAGIAFENPPFGPAGCLMYMFAQYFGDWNAQRRSYRWKSLADALRHCQGDSSQLHRALPDAQAALHVLRYMAADSIVSVETR